MASTTAPVTFGQLSVLRSLPALGADAQHHAMLRLTVLVPAGTTHEDVTAAWQVVIEANESLRTTYELVEGPERPRQRVHPPSRAVLRAHDVGASTGAHGDADDRDAMLRVAAGLCTTAIRLDELPWRAVVVVHRGRVLGLAVAVHHVAADHAATESIEAQMAAVLAGSDPGRQQTPSEVAETQAQARHANESALEHWVQVWKGLPTGRYRTDATPRVRAEIYSTDALRAARSLAADLHVSMPSVVLGVTSMVVSRATGSAGTTWGLIAANRLEPDWAEVVTSMNQLAPVYLPAPPEADPRHALQESYFDVLEAYLNGMYDVDTLTARLTAAGAVEPNPVRFDCYFNFLPSGAQTPSPDDVCVRGVEVRQLPRTVGPRLNVSAANTDEGLHLVVRAGTQTLAPEATRDVVTAIEAALVDIAGQASSTIAEVSFTATGERVSALRPGERPEGVSL